MPGMPRGNDMRWILMAVISIVVTILIAAYLDRPREVSLNVRAIEGGGAQSLDSGRIRRDIESMATQ